MRLLTFGFERVDTDRIAPSPLSHFETVKQFCSWLGLSPGTKISGGKVPSAKTKQTTNRVHQTLKMAAMSLWHSDSVKQMLHMRPIDLYRPGLSAS